MPNHVSNRLIFSDISIKEKILELCSTHDGGVCLDFEKILPSPNDIYHGDLSREDEKRYPGEKNWYGWNIKNWGTKWNAYHGSVEIPSEGEHKGKLVVTFSTAWNCPDPVIDKLSNILKKTFEYRYIDEGWGFAGRDFCVVENGVIRWEINEIDCATDDLDFVNLCKELKGYDPTEREEEIEE